MSQITKPSAPEADRPHEGRSSGSSRRRARNEGRHTVELLAVFAVGLVPWTVVLGLMLPSDYRVHAWRITWVGFDAMLLAAMAATAVLGRRRTRAAVIPALATAVLLVCDAWFDVSLDLGTPGVWTSAALAVFVELPMAAFLLHRVNSLLRLQWMPAEQTSSPGRATNDAAAQLATVRRSDEAAAPADRTLILQHPAVPAGAQTREEAPRKVMKQRVF